MTDNGHDQDGRERTPYEAPPNAPVRRRASLVILVLAILFVAATVALVLNTWREGPVSIDDERGGRATPPLIPAN